MDGHRIRFCGLEHPVNRGPQVGSAVGGWQVRVIGKDIKHITMQKLFPLRHGSMQVGIAHGHNREIGIQYQIRSGQAFEERPEFHVHFLNPFACGDVVGNAAGRINLSRGILQRKFYRQMRMQAIRVTQDFLHFHRLLGGNNPLMFLLNGVRPVRREQFPCAFAEDFRPGLSRNQFKFSVRECVPALEVLHINHRRSVIENGLELGPAFLQILFGLLFGRQIARNLDESQQFLLFVPNGGYHDIRPKARAVLANTPRFIHEPPFRFGSFQFFGRKTAFCHVFRVEYREMFPNNLIETIALDAFRS